MLETLGGLRAWFACQRDGFCEERRSSSCVGVSKKLFFFRSAHATQVLLLLLLWVWYVCVVDGLLEAIDPLVIFMKGLGTLPFVICCGCLVAFCG